MVSGALCTRIMISGWSELGGLGHPSILSPDADDTAPKGERRHGKITVATGRGPRLSLDRIPRNILQYLCRRLVWGSCSHILRGIHRRRSPAIFSYFCGNANTRCKTTCSHPNKAYQAGGGRCERGTRRNRQNRFGSVKASLSCLRANKRLNRHRRNYPEQIQSAKRLPNFRKPCLKKQEAVLPLKALFVLGRVKRTRRWKCGT